MPESSRAMTPSEKREAAGKKIVVDADRSTVLTRGIGHVTGWLGSVPAIALSASVIATWVVGGFFVEGRFSNNTYQLLINTVTTAITFMMVFIIQSTQNRDGRAIQTKLDAQSEALYVIAHKLGLEDEIPPLLLEVIGVEDAPERAIKKEQDLVRGKRAGLNGGSVGNERAEKANESVSPAPRRRPG